MHSVFLRKINLERSLSDCSFVRKRNCQLFDRLATFFWILFFPTATLLVMSYAVHLTLLINFLIPSYITFMHHTKNSAYSFTYDTFIFFIIQNYDKFVSIKYNRIKLRGRVILPKRFCNATLHDSITYTT